VPRRDSGTTGRAAATTGARRRRVRIRSHRRGLGAFAFRDLDDYEQWLTDVAGPFAILVRGLPEDEREVLRARLREAFAPFATDGGCELPGLALCALAS
jgi:hypothetical protein